MIARYTDEEAIANCNICTLAENKRDCRRCPFNTGLIAKALKHMDNAPMPTREHDASWWCELIAQAQEKAWNIGEKCIASSKEWFEPEVKF
jgi:hypothetical protein